MRTIALCFALASSLITFCQSSQELEGVWKVVAIADEEMTYDLKRDSVSFARNVDFDTASAKLLFSRVGFMMRNAMYTFKQGHYVSTFNGEIDEEGSYLVSHTKALLTLRWKKNAVTYTKRYKFKFSSDELLLTPVGPSSGDELVLTLEREH